MSPVPGPRIERFFFEKLCKAPDQLLSCKVTPALNSRGHKALMLFKVLSFAVIFSLLSCAQARRGKTTPQLDRSPVARTCGGPEVRDQTKYIDNFANHWLNQDARYIITDPERAAFKSLSIDEERENFIEYFWYRRDPTPDTIENEFKDEHYRRIVYANQRFASRVPGWRTDRGRIYIMYGPPDSIESAAQGALREKASENIAENSSAPIEVWHYRYLVGIGQEVDFQFIDVCHCGDFHLTVPKSEKDVLAYGPCPRHSLCEPISPKPSMRSVMPPRVRFKELEEVVTARVRYNLLPFEVQTSAFRATEFTDWVSLTLQFQRRALSWEENEGRPWVNLHVFARFTTITGRVAAILEEEIKKPDDPSGRPDAASGIIQFSRSLSLRPGRYRLDLAVHDVNADRMGTWSRGIIVPTFYADNFESSPLLVADQIDVQTLHYAYPISGELYIGNVRIHPRIAESTNSPPAFHPTEQVAVFLQAYNLGVSPTTAKSDAVITYRIADAASGKIAMETQETNAQLRQVGEQITVQKWLSLNGIPKGEYHVCVTVEDRIAHRSSVSSGHILIE